MASQDEQSHGPSALNVAASWEIFSPIKRVDLVYGDEHACTFRLQKPQQSFPSGTPLMELCGGGSSQTS